MAGSSRSAAWISLRVSASERDTGVTVVRSITPRTPRMLSAIFTARSLASRLFTEPESVTIPSLVLTSTSLGNTPFSNANPASTAVVIPLSLISLFALAACKGDKARTWAPAAIRSIAHHLPAAAR